MMISRARSAGDMGQLMKGSAGRIGLEGTGKRIGLQRKGEPRDPNGGQLRGIELFVPTL